MKTYGIKMNPTFFHLQGWRIRHILYHLGPGNGADAILHRANVFKQRGHLPHDPLRHAGQAQHQPQRHRHRAHTDQLTQPQPDRKTRHRQQQQRIQQVKAGVETRHQPHLPVYSDQKVVHAFTGIIRFTLGMGKQLHRLDIGIGIHHPPGHDRTGIGLLLRHPPHHRNKKPHQQDITDQPDQQRCHQARVGKSHNSQRTDEIHRNIIQHINQLDDTLTHRQ